MRYESRIIHYKRDKSMKTRVIILAAGIGSRLKPFTDDTPKCLFKLGKDVTIVGRTVDIVKRNVDAEVIIAVGFLHEKIESMLCEVTFVYNPFYRVTNSIASLWFAREYLDDEVIIINSDVVFEEKLFKEILKIDNPATILMDSSKAYSADYKVATYSDRVVMMSKELHTCSGEYVGITKLSKDSTMKLRHKIEAMLKNTGFKMLGYQIDESFPLLDYDHMRVLAAKIESDKQERENDRHLKEKDIDSAEARPSQREEEKSSG